MMALARRSSYDGYGNFNTLSWEIRSVSASIFTKYKSLEVEAIRAYGLLRSFLAEPNHAESLEDCIEREFYENRNESLGNATCLQEKIKLDLIRQKSITGSGINVIERLLPKWRGNFKKAIKDNKVKLDNTLLFEQISELEKISSNNKSSELSSNLFIPIADWKGSVKYGIRIASIFSDSLEFEKGSFEKANSWLNELLIFSKNNDIDFNERIKKLKDFFIQKEDAQKNWDLLKDIDKCIIYCLAIVKSEILREKNNNSDHNTSKEDALALYINIGINEYTFNRPFKRTNFCECKRPSEFRNKFLLFVRNKGKLDIPKQLRVGIINFSNTFVGNPYSITEDTIRRKLPGLFVE